MSNIEYRFHFPDQNSDNLYFLVSMKTQKLDILWHLASTKNPIFDILCHIPSIENPNISTFCVFFASVKIQFYDNSYFTASIMKQHLFMKNFTVYHHQAISNTTYGNTILFFEKLFHIYCKNRSSGLENLHIRIYKLHT